MQISSLIPLEKLTYDLIHKSNMLFNSGNHYILSCRHHDSSVPGTEGPTVLCLLILYTQFMYASCHLLVYVSDMHMQLCLCSSACCLVWGGNFSCFIFINCFVFIIRSVVWFSVHDCNKQHFIKKRRK